MQEVDADRRMRILRGESVEAIVDAVELGNARDSSAQGIFKSHTNGLRPERKKRKRYGETDTDFEMRLASEQTLARDEEKQISLRLNEDSSIVDKKGNISLFSQGTTKDSGKNTDFEEDARRKKKKMEDQYTMRFENAAGFNQNLTSPWYSSNRHAAEDEAPGKDVWGNEDPRRKEREAARTISNDPLAMMKSGAARARMVEKERKQRNEERARAMKELEREQKRLRKKGRREEAEDKLEGFSLDAPSRSRSSGRTKRLHHEEDRSHRHKDKRYPADRDRPRSSGPLH